MLGDAEPAAATHQDVAAVPSAIMLFSMCVQQETMPILLETSAMKEEWEVLHCGVFTSRPVSHPGTSCVRGVEEEKQRKYSNFTIIRCT